MNEFRESPQIPLKNNGENFVSEYQQNIDVLKTESTSLLKVYEIAVGFDPRLSDVKIVPIVLEENNKNKPFFARRPWKTKSGKGEVHVLFGDGKNVGQIAVDSITENPDFEQQFRSWVYLKPSEKISPQLARAYIFLHELGHVIDYYDHLKDPKTYDAKVKTLKNSLPLGYLSGTGISQRYNSGDAEFRQKVESNFGTLENAIVKNRQIKHGLVFEQKADKFAQEVLQQNTTVLTTLANNQYKS